MRIWIDILTPKDVFFTQVLNRKLQKRGHTTVLTTRRYEQVLQTLQMKNLHAITLGKHGGKSLYGKLIASARRVEALASFISKEKPDVAISSLSPEVARVSFGLGTSHIGISDSPHARAVSRLTVPLLTLLFTPWVIPKNKWTPYGINKNNIIHYKALDPFIWLRDLKPNIEVLKKLGLRSEDLIITSRLEEAFAAYLLGKATDESPVLIPILKKLMREYPKAKFVVLARYGKQPHSIKQALGKKVIVPKGIINGPSLLAFSKLFIGAGGTMTQEAALLGVPAISCFPAKTLDVNRYFLMPERLVFRAEKPKKALAIIRKMLNNIDYYVSFQKDKAIKVMARMEDPVEVIINKVEKLAEKNRI